MKEDQGDYGLWVNVRNEEKDKHPCRKVEGSKLKVLKAIAYTKHMEYIIIKIMISTLKIINQHSH